MMSEFVITRSSRKFDAMKKSAFRHRNAGKKLLAICENIASATLAKTTLVRLYLAACVLANFKSNHAPFVAVKKSKLITATTQNPWM